MAEDNGPIRVGAEDGAALVTNLKVSSVTGTTITGVYDSLANNQPSTYGNVVYIWQNPNQIPYGTKPLDSYSISGDSPNGGFSFPDLQIQIKSYVMGFAVGPDVSQICSTAYVPAAGNNFQYFQSTLDIQDVTTDSAVINYSTPTGNLPNTNKNWVGLWQGAAPSYTKTPDAQATVDNDNAVGQAVINGYKFLRGTTYTVAYFMGPKQTMMASSFTFST